MDLQSTLEKKEEAIKPKPPSDTEPWEKDLGKEVSSLLAQKPARRGKEPPPIDLRQLQKPLAQPPLPVQPGQPSGQSKIPPIDLRKTQPTPVQPTPTLPRAAIPQPQSTAAPLNPIPPAPARMTPQLQDLPGGLTSHGTINNQLRAETGTTLLEEKMRAEPPRKAVLPKSEPAPDGAGAGDPYREPIDETGV